MEEENQIKQIEMVIIRRLDGLKNRNHQEITESIYPNLYSRIDDWPPGEILYREDALKNEAEAIKVLQKYKYKISNLNVRIIKNFAWASFILNYEGVIRKKSFKMKSRVTEVLAFFDSNWRIVHEHFSMIPIYIPLAEEIPIEPEVEQVIKSDSNIDEAIIKVLDDGSEKHIAKITEEVSRIINREVSPSQIVDSCKTLVSKGLITRRGRFYPRYQSVGKKG